MLSFSYMLFLDHCSLLLSRALRVKRSDEDASKDDADVATLLQKKGEGKPCWIRPYLASSSAHLSNVLPPSAPLQIGV
jgi:hypothetical protein